jgi:hypothetical protein
LRSFESDSRNEGMCEKTQDLIQIQRSRFRKLIAFDYLLKQRVDNSSAKY